ncbi:hypothetical protein F4678DRAFT_485658 [Xylaria arbuscula]|nr:hypothetical protein F4678DRAFT_485658 [Xylaria arbuscula]
MSSWHNNTINHDNYPGSGWGSELPRGPTSQNFNDGVQTPRSRESYQPQMIQSHRSFFSGYDDEEDERYDNRARHDEEPRGSEYSGDVVLPSVEETEGTDSTIQVDPEERDGSEIHVRSPVDERIDAVLSTPRLTDPVEARFKPRVDVADLEDMFIIDVHLPGAAKEDIKVSWNGMVIVISGVIPRCIIYQGRPCLVHSGSSVGRFSECIRLPLVEDVYSWEGANYLITSKRVILDQKIHSWMMNGVLKVVVPVVEIPLTQRNIEVW